MLSAHHNKIEDPLNLLLSVSKSMVALTRKKHVIFSGSIHFYSHATVSFFFVGEGLSLGKSEYLILCRTNIFFSF